LSKVNRNLRVNPSALNGRAATSNRLNKFRYGNSHIAREFLQERLGCAQAGVIRKQLAGCFAHCGCIDVPVDLALLDKLAINAMRNQF
jgi:hypothetical protein